MAAKPPDEFKGIRTGPVLTRQILGSTLPWNVHVQFKNDAGEVVFEWNPQCRITHWDQSVSLRFGPKDTFYEL